MKTTMKMRKEETDERENGRVAKNRRFTVVFGRCERRLNGMSKNKQTKTLSGSADKLLHIERRAKCLPIRCQRVEKRSTKKRHTECVRHTR